MRITLTLEPNEKSALIKLASQEYRDPRYQAVKIIRDELTRRGLIPQEQTTQPQPSQALQPAIL
jgi:hypothetical protein